MNVRSNRFGLVCLKDDLDDDEDDEVVDVELELDDFEDFEDFDDFSEYPETDLLSPSRESWRISESSFLSEISCKEYNLNVIYQVLNS